MFPTPPRGPAGPPTAWWSASTASSTRTWRRARAACSRACSVTSTGRPSVAVSRATPGTASGGAGPRVFVTVRRAKRPGTPRLTSRRWFRLRLHGVRVQFHGRVQQGRRPQVHVGHRPTEPRRAAASAARAAGRPSPAAVRPVAERTDGRREVGRHPQRSRAGGHSAAAVRPVRGAPSWPAGAMCEAARTHARHVPGGGQQSFRVPRAAGDPRAVPAGRLQRQQPAEPQLDPAPSAPSPVRRRLFLQPAASTTRDRGNRAYGGRRRTDRKGLRVMSDLTEK